MERAFACEHVKGLRRVLVLVRGNLCARHDADGLYLQPSTSLAVDHDPREDALVAALRQPSRDVWSVT